MKKIISILMSLAILTALPVSVANAADTATEIKTLYVATDGNDSNSGTIDSPFATIAGARDAIRKIKAESGLPEGGIKVYIRGGTYTLTESLKFTEEDSGTKESPIVYQEYPGEDAIISGGVTIPGKAFKKVKDKETLDRFYPEVQGKIVSVNLKDYGVTDFGTWESNGTTYEPWELAGETNRAAVPGLMVFCDDEALDIARVPNRNENLGWDYYEVGAQSKIKAASGGTGATFGYTDDKIENWKTYEGVAVYGFWSESWKMETSQIKSVDYNNKTITLKHPLGSGPRQGRRYVYLNVLEELDSPGEYYIDTKTGELYLYARDNLKKENVGVTGFGRDASTDHLISCDHASYITFRGLTVTLSRTTGIYVKAGRGITIDNCDIKNIGRTAVAFGAYGYTTKYAGRGMGAIYSTEYMNYIYGIIDREEWETEWAAYDHKLTNSRIKNTGSYGVIAGGGDILEVEPANFLIENCEVSYTGLYESVLCMAVRIFGMGTTVRGCSIHHNPASGILFDGCDLIMEYNDLYNNCIDNSDYGVFYSCGWQNEHNLGTEIRYNYIHDVDNVIYEGDDVGSSGDGISSRHAVYNDNCQPFLEVHHNLIANIPTGFFQASGYENNWYDNVFVDVLSPIDIYGNNGVASSLSSKGTPFYYVGHTNFINPAFTENEKFKAYYPQWEEVRQKLLDRGSSAWQPDQIVSGNVCVFYETPEYFTTQYFKDTIYVPGVNGDYCTVENNLNTKEDIGFVDIDHGDYRFKEDAKIFETHPELRKVDISKMGYKADKVSEITDNSVILKVNDENAYVFGENKLTDSQNPEVKPYIEGGRTLVPIRFISEAFGAEVSYDNGIVTIKSDGKEIEMKIGDNKFTVDGESVEMDTAAKIADGRTFVPLRAVSEALSKEVFWDDSGLIIISSDKNLIDEEADADSISKILDFRF